jgi:hypothetical protein
VPDIATIVERRRVLARHAAVQAAVDEPDAPPPTLSQFRFMPANFVAMAIA